MVGVVEKGGVAAEEGRDREIFRDRGDVSEGMEEVGGEQVSEAEARERPSRTDCPVPDYRG